MGHTPGPWMIGDVQWIMNQQTGMGYSYRPITAGSWELAQVWEDAGDREMEDNVLLIAAAPELLAALHGVLHWAECECQRLASDTPANEDPPLCDYCVAKAAIAKAEGRTE